MEAGGVGFIVKVSGLRVQGVAVAGVECTPIFIILARNDAPAERFCHTETSLRIVSKRTETV